MKYDQVEAHDRVETVLFVITASLLLAVCTLGIVCSIIAAMLHCA